MIIQYKNPPSSEELQDMAKKALANMGYDTPEKRKEWYEENSKPIVLIGRRVDDDKYISK